MKPIPFYAPILAVFCLLSMPTPSRAQLPLEEIAVSLLSERFGIDPGQMLGFLGRSDLNVFDAAPYYSTSYYTDEPVDEVWRLREQGLGWGQIAHRLGMHPGTFNKLRKSGAFERDEIWESIYEDRYGIRESDYDQIRRRGGSIRDVLPASVIARASGTSPVTVYQRYRSTRNWDRTAAYYKTDLRRHRQFARKNVKPAKSFTKLTGDPVKAKSAVKGRAHKTIRAKSSGSAGARAKGPVKRFERNTMKRRSSSMKQIGKGSGAVRKIQKGPSFVKQSGGGPAVGKGLGRSGGKGGGKGRK